MNFFQLLNPERRLLFISILFLLFVFPSCKEQRGPVTQDSLPAADSLNAFKEVLREKLATQLKVNARKVFDGSYFDTSGHAFAAIVRKDSKALQNMYIIFFDTSAVGQLNAKFITGMLEGDPESIFISEIKFKNHKNSFLYFDTGDFLMGTGGGEIFLYLIDAYAKKVFSAHFVADKDKGFSLYIPKEISEIDVKNYFLAKLKNNYSPISLITKDILY